jgi:hypothetical protein
VVVAAAGFGVKQLLGGSDDNNKPAPNRVVNAGQDEQTSSGGNSSSDSGSKQAKAPATPARRERTVMVLNGTGSEGLAGDMKDQLVNAGYADGNVSAGNVPQGTGTIATSVVFYKRGAGTQARDVARVLGIGSAQVKPIDAALQSSAPDKSVVVEIGADKSGD